MLTKIGSANDFEIVIMIIVFKIWRNVDSNPANWWIEVTKLLDYINPTKYAD